ncbi:Iron uptake system component EfeO precursor [Methyloligella halotolerans]|uniref:Iron uptake system component EfeO n=1 Tax=Methyloligella halotolerans TaxID=1177755 RepID=A0A1E2RY41_9HYPH|nr:iron uptake system protein EfeO [Methyloligella halotolerans]ODA67025.1 Iron uptake system component EfeO precursor [Methyloligella halotolerans]
MPEQQKETAPTSRWVYGGLGAAILLTLAGGAAFYAATQKKGTGEVASDYTVSVSAKSCEPNEMTVPGGKRSFEIVNTSDRPIEWEILDGVMVVAERENIAPGFRQTLTAQLAPGEYEITCGLLSNPRGKLTVTESEEARAAAADVGLRNFLGPLSEYKVYLVLQGARTVAEAEDLATLIGEGDLDAARAKWEVARLPYKRVEPVAYRFSDLENSIDPVADYLAEREGDAGFTGYHRIEYGLFEENSTEGLKPVADQLVADLKTLKTRLAKLKLDPALLISIPAEMARQLAQGKIAKGEDRYAETDLADIAANFEGIRKIAGLLQAVVKPVDPALEAEIEEDIADIGAQLDALKAEDGYPAYSSVDDSDRAALADAFGALADTLDRLNSVIG